MTSLLSIHALQAGYHKKPVLHCVDLSVNEGEIVALIGPNGSGKSTVLKVIAGLLPAWQGELRWLGNQLAAKSPAARTAHGITLAPQGNRVFNGMSVLENLDMGGFGLPASELRQRRKEATQLFPELAGRLHETAGLLSGGQQQMLALARALMARPQLLLLDEPSIGLSPMLTRRVLDAVVEIHERRGISIIVVEQKVREALRICHRVFGLRLGRTALQASPAELADDPELLHRLFL